MTEYTSLEVSERLTEVKFRAKKDYDALWNMDGNERTDRPVLTSYPRWKDSKTHSAYRSDTLLAWLMSHGFFSRRAATIQIEYRAVMVGDAIDSNVRWVGHYFVTALSGSRQEIGRAEAPTLPDALAEVVMRVLEMKATA